MRNNKVSIVNASPSIKKPKVSQFCVQHKWFSYIIAYILYTLESISRVFWGCQLITTMKFAFKI
jgi:hypothetical protein